ncbi:MAG: DivIVA domain-containing protein [Clostridia bacterium]|nr:DivIVA domain-containing protein [Clostridia bacterium]
MMTPLQISTQRFAPNGKGGYRASDVDAFIQKVYKSYTKLYNDNSILSEKLETVAPVIEEYNKNKAAIADALISAQTVSGTKLTEAQREAQIIVDAANKNADIIIASKKEEAEKYYVEKTKEAEIRLRELELGFAKLQKEADDYRAAYISKVTAEVESFIAQANEKAAAIVSDAYNDARIAREKADEVVATANAQLEALKAETAKVKSELSALILVADSAVKSISDYELVHNTDEADNNDISVNKISIDDIEPFEINVKYEPAAFAEPEVEAVMPVYEEVDTHVDISNTNEIVIEDVDLNHNASDEMTDFFSNSTEAKRQQAEMPDVSSYLSKIFDSDSSDEEDSFGFEDLISESSKF